MTEHSIPHLLHKNLLHLEVQQTSDPTLKVIAIAYGILNIPHQARLSVEGQPDLATSSDEVIRLHEEVWHK